jgi:hypothetical protein
MFGSEILEIAIGLAFVYMILSLACTVLNEWIAMVFATRSKALEGWVGNLLDDSELLSKVYDHPLIKGLSRQGYVDKKMEKWFVGESEESNSNADPQSESKSGKNESSSGKNSPPNSNGMAKKILRGRRPSYIPTQTFAMALLDVLAEKGQSKTGSTKRRPKSIIKDVIAGLEDGNYQDLKKVIFAPLEYAGVDPKKYEEYLAAARVSTEQWFDSSMDRLSGWYKRKSQLVVLMLALIACIVLNADSITIIETLANDNAVRASFVKAAEEAVKEEADKEEATTPKDNSPEGFKQYASQLDSLGLPIGWILSSEKPDDPRLVPKNFWAWIYKILGLLCTVLAVSLGAPFWFDVLKRIVNMRSSGSKVERKRDESQKTTPVNITGTQ